LKSIYDPGVENLGSTFRTALMRTKKTLFRMWTFLVPWQNGKTLCCDVTVICPLADSYISRQLVAIIRAVLVTVSSGGYRTWEEHIDVLKMPLNPNQPTSQLLRVKSHRRSAAKQASDM